MFPMDLTEFEESQVKEVYARFGLAMYQGQCVERALAIVLATEYGPGIKKMTRTEYDQLLEKLFKKTLGGLLIELFECGRISSNFESDLRNALARRNWLAHHYFWERAPHFMTIKGRQMMIDELTEIADELNSLDQQFTEVSQEWMKNVGMPESVPHEEMKKLLEGVE